LFGHHSSSNRNSVLDKLPHSINIPQLTNQSDKLKIQHTTLPSIFHRYKQNTVALVPGPPTPKPRVTQVRASSPDSVLVRMGLIFMHTWQRPWCFEKNSGGWLTGPTGTTNDSEMLPGPFTYIGGEDSAAANFPVLLVQPDPSRRIDGFWKTPGFLDAGSQSRYSARSPGLLGMGFLCADGREGVLRRSQEPPPPE